VLSIFCSIDDFDHFIALAVWAKGVDFKLFKSLDPMLISPGRHWPNCKRFRRIIRLKGPSRLTDISLLHVVTFLHLSCKKIQTPKLTKRRGVIVEIIAWLKYAKAARIPLVAGIPHRTNMETSLNSAQLCAFRFGWQF
jgi:hypothetical protein